MIDIYEKFSCFFVNLFIVWFKFVLLIKILFFVCRIIFFFVLYNFILIFLMVFWFIFLVVCLIELYLVILGFD